MKYENFINVIVYEFLALRKVLLCNKLFEHREELFHLFRIGLVYVIYLQANSQICSQLSDKVHSVSQIE